MNPYADVRRLKKKVSHSAKFMSEISGDVFQASDKLETVGDLSKTRDVTIANILQKIEELEGRVMKLESIKIR